MDVEIPMPFAAIAFFALGIERILYGYCFICTNHFKKSIDEKKIPGVSKVPRDGIYWKSMQRLGMHIKVFQFGVVIYDLLVLDVENIKANLIEGGMLAEENLPRLFLGFLLIFVGQLLNYTTFTALGAKGVYYSYEFGYPAERVTCFPYNIGISDPQYWGVVLCIFGIYTAVGATSYMIPAFELFWYIMSMKVLENERGRRWALAIYGPGEEVKKEI
ncbi:hypothetical protein ACHAXT_005184 [Thalassiosira profunda]